jgi:hypothetical protein
MHITWKRTVIGNDILRPAFAGLVDGLIVGRIIEVDAETDAELWEWYFALGHSGFRANTMSGVENGYEIAVAAVETLFYRYLATPTAQGGGKDLKNWHGLRP